MITRLMAHITPEMCPHLTEEITVINKRIISIKGGNLTFYVTLKAVVVVVTLLNSFDVWKKNGFETNVFEIKTKITQLK